MSGWPGCKFLVDNAPLPTEDTTTPYSVTWNTTTATNGVHTVTAQARDAAGNITTSTPVSRHRRQRHRRDTTPPTVSLTAPANGATVSGNVTFSANAADNVGVAGVTFLSGGAPLGAEDTTAPYSITVDASGAANGPYTLTARARDAAGNITTSTPVVVNVLNGAADTTPPTVNLTRSRQRLDRVGQRDPLRQRRRQCRGGRGEVPGGQRPAAHRGHHHALQRHVEHHHGRPTACTR